MALPALELTHNPFISIPPIRTYERDLRPLFSARDAEVRKLCRLVEQSAAIFVIAPYGGGKTVVLLEAMARLRGGPFVAYYVQFKRDKGFRESIIGEVSNFDDKIGSFETLRATIHQIRQQSGRLVLAVDDLDRASDLDEIFQATHDVRDFLSEGASVIVTGQPFGVTQDLHTSAGGIFHEVQIPSFSGDDFYEMLVKYLRSAHAVGGLEKTHPFSEKSAQFLCREVAEARLTPRLFNFAMFEIIEFAERERKKEIALEFALEHWPTLADRIIKSLTDLQIRHLNTIFQFGRISEDTPEAINVLGASRLAEYPEIKERVLRPLLEKNLLQMRTGDGKEFFQVTPHAALSIGEALAREREHTLPFEQLIESLDRSVKVRDGHEKGRLLEDFAGLFFSHIPGFRIPQDGMRLRTKHEELDVSIEIEGHQHHLRYGPFTSCECKNWSKPVSWDQLASFRDKLESRGCKFGIFIALSGVTEGFREKMKIYLGKGIVITLLTEKELRRLEDRVTPGEILRDAYYATIKYEGEGYD